MTEQRRFKGDVMVTLIHGLMYNYNGLQFEKDIPVPVRASVANYLNEHAEKERIVQTRTRGRIVTKENIYEDKFLFEEIVPNEDPVVTDEKPTPTEETPEEAKASKPKATRTRASE